MWPAKLVTASQCLPCGEGERRRRPPRIGMLGWSWAEAWASVGLLHGLHGQVRSGKPLLPLFYFLFYFYVFNFIFEFNSILFADVFTYFNWDLIAMVITWFFCSKKIFNIFKLYGSFQLGMILYIHFDFLFLVESNLF
jgi:hypothetical protein